MKTPEEIQKLALKAIPDNTTAGWKDGFSATERSFFIKGYTQCQQDNAEILKSFCVYLESITQTNIIDKDKLINNFNYLNKQ